MLPIAHFSSLWRFFGIKQMIPHISIFVLRQTLFAHCKIHNKNFDVGRSAIHLGTLLITRAVLACTCKRKEIYFLSVLLAVTVSLKV